MLCARQYQAEYVLVELNKPAVNAFISLDRIELHTRAATVRKLLCCTIFAALMAQFGAALFTRFCHCLSDSSKAADLEKLTQLPLVLQTIRATRLHPTNTTLEMIGHKETPTICWPGFLYENMNTSTYALSLFLRVVFFGVSAASSRLLRSAITEVNWVDFFAELFDRFIIFSVQAQRIHSTFKLLFDSFQS